MLSIIICSINPKYLLDIKKNIQETIGIEYEMIVYDNVTDNFGICKVYNLCAKKAKYEYLLFIHEDVKFHTQNWGLPLIEILQTESIGIVGVSGANYKSAIPSTWSMVPKEYYRINAMQRWSDGRSTTEIIKDSVEKDLSRVVVLDGFFLAMRKEIWNQYHFDEMNLKGFHFYDLDMSIRIGEKFQLMVTHQILLEHFSEGKIDRAWIDEAIKYHKRMAKHFPLSISNISKHERNRVEHYAIIGFIFILIKKCYPVCAILSYYLKSLSLGMFKKENLILIKYFILSKFKSKL